MRRERGAPEPGRALQRLRHKLQRGADQRDLRPLQQRHVCGGVAGPRRWRGGWGAGRRAAVAGASLCVGVREYGVRALLQ